MCHLTYLFMQELYCPGNGSCSNEGNCDETTGTCICNFGFEGSECEGTWYNKNVCQMFILKLFSFIS